MTSQVFVIATFLSITWGIYLAGTIWRYRKKPSIAELRRFTVALCVWLFVFSFVFRTFCVLIGIGNDIAGQIVFFALLGSNVAGSLFCATTIWRDR